MDVCVRLPFLRRLKPCDFPWQLGSQLPPRITDHTEQPMGDFSFKLFFFNFIFRIRKKSQRKGFLENSFGAELMALHFGAGRPESDSQAALPALSANHPGPGGSQDPPTLPAWGPPPRKTPKVSPRAPRSPFLPPLPELREEAHVPWARVGNVNFRTTYYLMTHITHIQEREVMQPPGKASSWKVWGPGACSPGCSPPHLFPAATGFQGVGPGERSGQPPSRAIPQLRPCDEHRG